MKFYTRPKRTPTVIIVSLIDILAILLIFVIVTTTFRREQPAVVIKLPESSTAEAVAVPTDPVILSISPEGKIGFDKRTDIQLAELGEAVRALRAAEPNRPMALQADTKAPFGTIIRVLDVLKEAGVPDLPAFTEKAE